MIGGLGQNFHWHQSVYTLCGGTLETTRKEGHAAVPCLSPHASLTRCPVNLQSPRGFLLPLTSCTELVEFLLNMGEPGFSSSHPSRSGCSYASSNLCSRAIGHVDVEMDRLLKRSLWEGRPNATKPAVCSSKQRAGGHGKQPCPVPSAAETSQNLCFPLPLSPGPWRQVCT